MISSRSSTTNHISLVLLPNQVLSFVIFLLLQYWSTVNASYLVEIGSGSEQCYTIRVAPTAPSYISIEFEWIDEELSVDPTFVIFQDNAEPHRNVLYESPDGHGEGTFTHFGSGTFELCLSNGKSLSGELGSGGDDIISGGGDGEPRHAGFNIHVRQQPKEMGGEEDLEGEVEGADNLKTTNLLKLSGEVLDGMTFLADHQANTRAREASKKKLQDATSRRVIMWTMLEAAVLIVISASQVLYLRKFFERKRYL